MKYIRQVLYYMFRYFPRVVLPVLPSAILLGIFYRQTKPLVFVKDFAEAESTVIADVFGMLFEKNVWYYIILLPVFFVAVSFSCSYLLTMVYKHFRTGKLSVRMPLSNVNHGLEAVMPSVALIMVMLMAYKALFGCIVSLITEVFVGGGAPGIGAAALVAVLGFASYFFVIFFLMYPVVGISLMLVYGYTFTDAIGESLQIGGKKGFLSLLLGYMFPFVVNAVIAYILMAVSAPQVVVIIVNIIVQIFVIAYLVLFSIISVFTQQKLERIDLKKLY